MQLLLAIRYGKVNSSFSQKNNKKKTSSAEHRKAKHKKSTKAELKKEYLNHCCKTIAHLELFNRIQMVNEKTTHLNTAMLHLEQCLVHRPGNHILRNQIKLCKEELIILKVTGKRSVDNIVEILFTADLL